MMLVSRRRVLSRTIVGASFHSSPTSMKESGAAERSPYQQDDHDSAGDIRNDHLDGHNGDDRVANDDYGWLGLGVVDIEADTESMRRESEVRLRVKSSELKRFHDKICVRVTARERQNRLQAQRAQKYLDAKCAKLFATTESAQQNGKTPSARISTRSHFQELKESKRAIVKDCPLGRQIERSLHLDSQIRDELLRSTEISRAEAFSSVDSEHSRGHDDSTPAASPVLLPEQRVALYSLVRRQYMEMNRVKAQSNVWRGATQPPHSSKVTSPLPNASVAAAVCGSRVRRAKSPGGSNSDERLGVSTGVKVVDMTSGCEARAHRVTATSSTPWRRKTVNNSTAPTATKEHERFLHALQAQLGTPALCSCSKAEPSSTCSLQPCANNCVLYKQPKKREKLLASVYKQQQQDVSAAAVSPSR